MAVGRKPETRIVRPLRDGQITIPAEFRRRLGITDETMLQVTLVGGELHIRPVQVAEVAPGAAFLRDLYDYFAPARQEVIDRGYGEQEIDAAIEDAVRAVHEQHAP